LAGRYSAKVVAEPKITGSPISRRHSRTRRKAISPVLFHMGFHVPKRTDKYPHQRLTAMQNRPVRGGVAGIGDQIREWRVGGNVLSVRGYRRNAAAKRFPRICLCLPISGVVYFIHLPSFGSGSDFVAVTSVTWPNLNLL